MTDPIVYVSHFRIRPGKEDEWWSMVDQVLPDLDASKPRTLFQHFYVDQGGHLVSIVHVFPDTEAFELHIEGAGSRSEGALQFLEPIGAELYGQPTESFIAAMADMADLLQVYPTHKAGFDRF